MNFTPNHSDADAIPPKPVLNPVMKAAFIAQHQEAYAKKIGGCMLDAKEAQTMTLEFFSYGIRAGLNLSECIDLLVAGREPILLGPAFRLRPSQTADLISFIKQIDAREVYALAGTTPLRDYIEDPINRQWTPRPESV